MMKNIKMQKFDLKSQIALKKPNLVTLNVIFIFFMKIQMKKDIRKSLETSQF